METGLSQPGSLGRSRLDREAHRPGRDELQAEDDRHDEQGRLGPDERRARPGRRTGRPGRRGGRPAATGSVGRGSTARVSGGGARHGFLLRVRCCPSATPPVSSSDGHRAAFRRATRATASRQPWRAPRRTDSVDAVNIIFVEPSFPANQRRFVARARLGGRQRLSASGSPTRYTSATSCAARCAATTASARSPTSTRWSRRCASSRTRCGSTGSRRPSRRTRCRRRRCARRAASPARACARRGCAATSRR